MNYFILQILLNSNFGEDVNGMTIHEKLDKLLEDIPQMTVTQFNSKNVPSEASTTQCAQTIIADKDYDICIVFISASVGNRPDSSTGINSLTLTSNGNANIELLNDSGNLIASNSYRQGAGRSQVYQITNLKSSEVLTATMTNSSTYGGYILIMQLLSRY